MLAVALAVTAVAASAVGVSVTSASTNATTVTIKLLAQSNGQGNPQLQAIFDRFMQLNPSIKVDATYLPIGTTYANTLRTQLASGNAPDVFYVTAGSGGLQSVLPLAKAGYVQNLAKRPWVKTLPLAPANRPFFWRQGRLTALPFAVVPVGVMYHTNGLADLGIQVPRTMNQFLAACRTARSKGKHFLNLAGANAQNAGLFAHRAGNEPRACEGPGLEPEADHGQDDVREDTRVASDAAAHRRHEERRVLPAGSRIVRQHPGDPGLRLRPGRGMDASVVDRRAAQGVQPAGDVQLLPDAG